MKLTAQTTTKTAIAAAMAGRLGARPVDDAIFTESNQSFLADGEFFDEVEPRLQADAGTRGYANRPLRRYSDLWRNNVFCPVALAGRHVAGQREIRQRRERNVVRAPDAGLQHPAAPHRDAVLLADVVNVTRHGESAHTAKLYIDDLARAQFHGRARLLFGMHAFIQANWSFEPLLKLDVTINVIPAERLLDHHQIKTIELLQERKIIHCISGVGIHHQLDSRKLLPQTLHLLQVFARLDLDLDALVARREFFLHVRG